MLSRLPRYTGYKKFHAYKLFVVCSLFTKNILGIFIRPATVSDTLCWALDDTIAPLVHEQCYLLGDAALNGLSSVIAPFSTTDINLAELTTPILAAQMRAFNTVLCHHHSYRSLSYHTRMCGASCDESRMSKCASSAEERSSLAHLRLIVSSASAQSTRLGP